MKERIVVPDFVAGLFFQVSVSRIYIIIISDIVNKKIKNKYFYNAIFVCQ